MPKALLCSKCRKPRSGKHYYCRDCNRAYNNQWTKDHPGRHNVKPALKRAWYAKNPERRRAYQLKWRLKQAAKVPYEQMLIEQSGVCAACGVDLLSLPTRQVHLDHCHTTKRIRGILCHHCNTALGLMKDDPIKLRNLARYAETSKEAPQIMPPHLPSSLP